VMKLMIRSDKLCKNEEEEEEEEEVEGDIF
jgi:hypothetical protein